MFFWRAIVFGFGLALFARLASSVGRMWHRTQRGQGSMRMSARVMRQQGFFHQCASERQQSTQRTRGARRRRTARTTRQIPAAAVWCNPSSCAWHIVCTTKPFCCEEVTWYHTKLAKRQVNTWSDHNAALHTPPAQHARSRRREERRRLPFSSLPVGFQSVHQSPIVSIDHYLINVLESHSQ